MSVAEMVSFTAGEQMIFGAGSGFSTEEWAEKYRIVVQGEKRERWSFSTAPHSRFILQLADKPYIRSIFMCFTPQGAKTNTALNIMCKTIDDAPGVGMYILPSEKAAERFSVRKMKKTFPAIDRIAEKMSSRKRDNRDYSMNFLNGAEWHVGWASSVSQLSEITLRYLIFDEIDKYEALKSEGNVIDYGMARLTDNPFTSLLMAFSSPGEMPSEIWSRLISADVIYRYEAQCPHCGKYHIMSFSNIKWPDGTDANTIEREHLAWYECPECAAVWSNSDRNKAVRAGRWVGFVLVADISAERDLSYIMSTYDEKIWSRDIPERPVSVGLHLPSWNIITVSLSKIASDFKRAHAALKTGDNTKMKAVVQRHKAVPYLEEIKKRPASIIMNLRDDRPRGIIPSVPIAGLTAGVDTQADGFYYKIRAWGFGMKESSWGIREGYVTSFDAVEEIVLNTPYLDINGNRFYVNIGLIDSGGDKTSEVYDFCRRTGFVACKGASRKMAQPYKPTKLEYYPDGRIMPGGLMLMNVNTIFFKDKLARKLTVSREDEGAYLFHSETTEDFASQMTVETKNEKTGLWECPSGAANHYFDCEVLNNVGAEMMGYKFQLPPEQDVEQEEKKDNKPKNINGRRW